MNGCEVTTVWGQRGRVVEWTPLSAGMCDVLIEVDGHHIAVASSDLRPLEGESPLPSRREAIAKSNAIALWSLRAIRDQLVSDWNKPWPGAEHGKALVGMSIDGAIAELEEKTNT